MKKRFLCVLLAAAVCCAEPAVGVMAAEAPAEAEQGSESLQEEESPAEADETDAAEAEEQAAAAEEAYEEAAPAPEQEIVKEETLTNEAADEATEDQAAEEAAPAEETLSAEGNSEISLTMGDMPRAFAFGVDTKLTFSVPPNKEYYYSVTPANAKEPVASGKLKAGNAVEGSQDAHVVVPLNFSDAIYEVGTYTLAVWESGKTAAEGWSKSFAILHSINPNDGKAEKPEIVAESVVYTGKEITPKFVIKINEGTKENPKMVTLTEGKDYKVTLISENKKEIGTVTAHIRALDENGKYTGSVDVEFQIQPHAPNLPVATCLNSTTIRLSWNRIAEAEGYVVERKDDNGSFISIAKVEGKDSLIYDNNTGLSTGNEYEYRIRAYATDSVHLTELAYSAAPANGTKIVLTCAAPKISEATSISTTKVKLVWNKIEGAKGYNVYQVKKNGKLKLIKGKLKKANYKVGKLKCGKSYEFVVKAYIMAKDGKTQLESAASASKKITAKPVTPKLVSAKSGGSGKIEVKWKRVSDCSGYMVYRKPVGEDEDWKSVKTIEGSSNVSFIDEKAETGVKYAYTVSAYKKVKKKKIQSLMDAKGLKAVAVCEGPVIITEQRRVNKANIFIKNVPGADGYYLYKKSGEGKFVKIATLQRQAGDYTIYGDMNVTVGTTYSYYAQAYTETDDKVVKGANGAVATLVMKAMTETKK